CGASTAVERAGSSAGARGSPPVYPRLYLSLVILVSSLSSGVGRRTGASGRGHCDLCQTGTCIVAGLGNDDSRLGARTSGAGRRGHRPDTPGFGGCSGCGRTSFSDASTDPAGRGLLDRGRARGRAGRARRGAGPGGKKRGAFLGGRNL